MGFSCKRVLHAKLIAKPRGEYMNILQSVLLQVVCVTTLIACAARQPVDRQADLDVAGIAKALGCTDDEVAVCVDVNCEPHEYRCANRADVKALLGVSDYPRN